MIHTLNWRRGMFRLWLVFSIAWVLLIAWIGYENIVIPRQLAAQANPCADARRADPKLGKPLDCFAGQNMFADLIPVGPEVAFYCTLAAVFPLGTIGAAFVVF